MARAKVQLELKDWARKKCECEEEIGKKGEEGK
jgi:hypothetical protein